MKQSTTFLGFLHAAGAAIYIALVSSIMTYGNQWFGMHDTQLTSIAALMLFVLSAAVMASLVFLRPLLWYLDSKKREALQLLAWTIGFLFLLTLGAFICLAIAHR